VVAEKPARHYWDAATCIGYLAEERDKVRRCQYVVDRAERGEVEIVVSALTLAEVLWFKGGPKLPKETSELIRAFFRREYILVVDVTRRVAERAQDIVWEYNVKPKDAIHVASALVANAERLDTFDAGMIALSGRVGGSPPLIIALPDLAAQAELPLHDPGPVN